MRSLTTAATVAAALTLILAGCGDDYDEDLIGALKSQGATDEQAECLIDELGESDVENFLQSGDEAPENAVEILAAIEECGVDPEEHETGGADVPSEPTADSDEGPDSAAAPDADAVATCLGQAGVEATPAEGPPVRIDLVGTAGSGSIFFYDDPEQASNAADQFTETFADAEEFASGAVGSAGWYYRDSAEEVAAIETCLAD